MMSFAGSIPKVAPAAFTSRKSFSASAVVPRRTVRKARLQQLCVAKEEKKEEKVTGKKEEVIKEVNEEAEYTPQARKGPASSEEAGFKVIGKAEIPALVPRGDFLDQLLKWSIMEFETNGRKRYGTKMVVDICNEYCAEDGTPTAFAIKMRRPEGGDLHIEVCMDDQEVEVEKTLEGFGKESNVDPEAEENPFARSYKVTGRNLIIRRLEGPLEDDMRPIVAKTLSALSKAVNTYYAFGSVYVDDST